MQVQLQVHGQSKGLRPGWNLELNFKPNKI